MANFNQQMNGIQPGLLGQPAPSQPSLSFPYGTNTNSNFNYFNNGLNNSMNLQSQYQFLKCRPVSSKEEARAAQIDFDGSLCTSHQVSYYTEPSTIMRDPREGRSYIRRRMYMEGKEKHKDTNSQLQELEAYLQELSTDITEMVRDASPEERATLRQKMTMLTEKIK